jgi:hypothetical protein
MWSVNLTVELDEVAPRVIWSDDLGAWGDTPTSGGSRWISVGVVKISGSGVVVPGGVVRVDGSDWIALDPLSPSGVMVDLVSDRGESVSGLPLLPGGVVRVEGLKELRVIAAPEQSDVARVRFWVGAGECQVKNFGGVVSVPGRPMPVMLRGAPDSSTLTISRAITMVSTLLLTNPVKLTSWSGRRFAGGQFAVGYLSTDAVEFLVGPDLVLPPAVPSAVAGVVVTDAVGYTRVGMGGGTSAAANYGRVDLSADVGVSVGYPGNQALYVRGLGSAPNAASFMWGSILLRGGDQ